MTLSSFEDVEEQGYECGVPLSSGDVDKGDSDIRPIDTADQIIGAGNVTTDNEFLLEAASGGRYRYMNRN